jgi:hypothetical protein
MMKPIGSKKPRATIEVDPDGSAVLLIDGEPVLACPTMEAILMHDRSAELMRAS